MEIEVEPVQVPRQYYRLVADLSDQLVESEVPQHHVDRALDKIERTILEALDHAEEEIDEDEGSDDDTDDDDEDRREG